MCVTVRLLAGGHALPHAEAEPGLRHPLGATRGRGVSLQPAGAHIADGQGNLASLLASLLLLLLVVSSSRPQRKLGVGRSQIQSIYTACETKRHSD